MSKSTIKVNDKVQWENLEYKVEHIYKKEKKAYISAPGAGRIDRVVELTEIKKIE